MIPPRPPALPVEFNCIFAGGGSGGHLFPALAIAEELAALEPGFRPLFLCSPRAVDHLLAAKSTGQFVPLEVPSLAEIIGRPWRGIPKFWSACRAAYDLLRASPNAVVVGTGGYISLPVGLVAAWLRRPLLLLEPNAVPGRATSLLTRFACCVCAGFQQTCDHMGSKSLLTGVALRPEMSELVSDRQANERPLLLILGGSQGARDLNTTVLNVVQANPALFVQWELLHQTGTADFERVQRAYATLPVQARTTPFLDDMADTYRNAALVISRAGATTLAELACAGLPAILLPHVAAVRDHQRRNAEVFSGSGAAICLVATQEPAMTEELATVLRQLLTDAHVREQMSVCMRQLARPNAARLIALQVKHHFEAYIASRPPSGG